MPEVKLPGCTPTPLAHYLKALGVFRLISEQADRGVRGCWRANVLDLRSSFEAEDLLQFLLEQYVPTPLVAPWNGSSGFYPKDNQRGIGALESSSAQRLQSYAAVIRSCRQVVVDLRLTEPPSGPENKAAKARLLTACRGTLSDEAIPWLDAALALTQDGPKYAPILGTGGIDGHLEFTNNFMQRLVEVVDPVTGAPTPRSAGWLEAALFGSRVDGLLGDKPIGQFLPGAAGGANASSGFDGAALINPWDFILMLEGAVVFAGTVTRRLASEGAGGLSYPFTVRSADAGYGTAAAADLKGARHETWVPLWENPATYQEVAALFAEGRATVGQRVARDGVDFARAVRRLGVDRGITAFERFGYMQRNGQSYLATPLGRWAVPRRASGQVALIDEVDAWFGAFERVAWGKTAPASLDRAGRRIREAIMGVCLHDTAAHWQEVLSALGRAEAALVQAPKTTAGSNLTPLPTLTAGWLRACDDGSVEFRLAVSLASVYDVGLGPLRANMIPLDTRSSWPKFDTDKMDQPGVVWGQATLCANMIAVLERRCLDAHRLSLPGLPLAGTRPARLEDIGAFLYGNVNERKLEALLWGLNAVRIPGQDSPVGRAAALPASYGLLKLAHLPHALRTTPEAVPLDIPYEAQVVRLAAAGRLTEATRLAAQRLRGSGLKPAVGGMHETPELARRIAAAVLFPISEEAVQWLFQGVLLPPREQSVTA